MPQPKGSLSVRGNWSADVTFNDIAPIPTAGAFDPAMQHLSGG